LDKNDTQTPSYWERRNLGDVPSDLDVADVEDYSGDWGAAGQVLEKMASLNCYIELEHWTNYWECLFMDYGDMVGRAEAATGPETISKASLIAFLERYE